MNNKLKEGFLGQRMLVLSRSVIATVKTNALINSLYLTDIGFFPHAVDHHRKRNNGSAEYVLIYCPSGEGVIKMKNKKVHLGPNNFFILPPKLAHEYYALAENPWSIYWLHFTGDKATAIYQKFIEQESIKQPALPLSSAISQHFLQLIAILEKGHLQSHLEFVNLNLWQLFTLLLYSQISIVEKDEQLEDSTVEKAIAYMTENIDTVFKVEEMAKQLNYSTSYVYNLFKQQTGYSPIQYLNNLKVQKACERLLTTRMSIKEISYSLGFKDQLYFSRLFKKLLGLSPVQYKAEHQSVL